MNAKQIDAMSIVANQILALKLDGIAIPKQKESVFYTKAKTFGHRTWSKDKNHEFSENSKTECYACGKKECRTPNSCFATKLRCKETVSKVSNTNKTSGKKDNENTE